MKTICTGLASELGGQGLIAVNLKSTFAVMRTATKAMGQGGSIELKSSAAARIGLPNHEAKSAAEAGVMAWLALRSPLTPREEFESTVLNRE